MPNPAAFLRGFEINRGSTLEDETNDVLWTVKRASSGHIVVQRFKEYQFPLSIELKAHGKRTGKDAIRAISSFTSGSRIVDSQYGNPYKCTIRGWTASAGGVEFDGEETIVKLTALGTGIRQYNSKTNKKTKRSSNNKPYQR